MEILEIISYNIQVGKKLDNVMKWISSEGLAPDIFCLQEFPEKKIPQFEQFLTERGYKFIYTQGIVLGGTQMGELTAYKHGKLLLLSRQDIPLGNHFLERRHKAVNGQRSALLTTFQANSITFSLANIHLSMLSPHSMRYKQLDIIIDTISEDIPSLIIGDFNYTSLLGLKRLFAFMTKHGYTCIGERLITHRLLLHIPQQLDYAFIKGMQPRSISVLKAEHSDHLPLYVKLELEN